MITQFIHILKSPAMKICSFFISLFMFCAAYTANAQPGSAGPLKFSLNEARDYALKSSPILLNSSRDVEIAKKMIWENTATGLPQVNFSSAYAYAPKLAGISNLFAGGDTTGGGSSPFPFKFNPNDLRTSFTSDIRVTQLIFSGEYIVGLKASKVYASLSELALTKSKIGIVETLTNTYFTDLIARQSKIILDSTLVTVQKTLFQTNELLKNGFVEATDVDQLKILESNIKSSLSVTNRQIELMDRLLKFQMGVPIDQPIVLTDQIEPLVNIMNMQAMVLDSFKIDENIDFKMLSTQEKLMKLNMQVTKAEFLPTIGGYYDRHGDYDRNFFNDQSPNMYGLSLNFPLWSSGQRLALVGQRRLEYLKAQTDRETGQEALLIQYETAMSAFLSARDIYALQKENRDLALRIYKKSITKFQEGVGSSLDLNQTQQQYFSAEGSYFNALSTLVSAKSKLESLTAKSQN
jgi:outer membrane protein